MLSGITILCFAASYGVALALEATRLFFRAPVRLMVLLGFAAAGIFAHTAYLWMHAQGDLAAGGAPLSSWYSWFLLAAWVLAAGYLAWAVRRPQTPVGLFMLPLVLLLIGAAYLQADATPFSREAAQPYWSAIHGGALLAGTVTVSLGLVAGVMYLVQSWRLRHKLAPRPGLQLPSLEWLEQMNERSLVVSVVLLGIGLVSGLVLNAIRDTAQPTIPWTDPVVVSSGILFLWLLAAALFNFLYRPARVGRKVAYLAVANFLFLAMVLGMVLWYGGHAAPNGGDAKASTGETRQ